MRRTAERSGHLPTDRLTWVYVCVKLMLDLSDDIHLDGMYCIHGCVIDILPLRSAAVRFFPPLVSSLSTVFYRLSLLLCPELVTAAAAAHGGSIT